MEEIRILSTTAILGYGFPMESFVEGMKRKPHVIAVDAGSTDPGPWCRQVVHRPQLGKTRLGNNDSCGHRGESACYCWYCRR